MVSALRLPSCILAALFVIATSGFAPHPAQAQKKLVRGIAIGVGAAIVGGIILNEIERDRRRSAHTYRSQPHYRRPHVSRRRTRRTREIQIALNTLGFEAGPADGVMGGQTRAAIRSYQDYIGVPVTGRLNNRQFAELKELSREQIANEYIAPRRRPPNRSPYSPNALN